MSFRPAVVAAMVSLAYFAAAALAVKTFGTNAPIWVANAIALIALLRYEPRLWPVFLAPVAVADFLAIALFGEGPPIAIALCDSLEILLAATAIRLSGGLPPPLFGGWQLLRFGLICLVVPVASSAAGAGVLWWMEGEPFLAGWLTWYVASALGLLIVTPFLLSWTDPQLREQQVSVALFARILFLVALAVVLFGQDRAALLFAIFPILLLVSWSTGVLGASTNALALAMVGIWFAMQSDGALSNMILPATSLTARIQAAQLYAASVLLTILPGAALVAHQRILTTRLREVVDVRAEFLAAMSHEIRTPLTGMLGTADLLEKEPLTEKQRIYVDAFRSSGRHLLNIINDILDFSRMETGKIELERILFSLPGLLERLRSIVQPLAVERGLELRFELSEHSPPVLKGDPTRIKQVLLNLVGNAIKFTDRGSVTVGVRHRFLNANDVCIRFEVRDTGIGIASENQAALFDPFTQADRSTARRYGGTGLGLAISKRLVEAMRGDLGLSSVPGAGSVFWFEVPLKLGDPADLVEAARAQAVEMQPRRILVAEDVALNRDILRDALSRQGHDLVFAEDGAEAVALAKREKFDLILMDIQMPIMDGVEATRQIRNLDGEIRNIPILALTANVMAKERERYLLAGMNDCLMKPIDWQQLSAAIARCEPHTRQLAAPDGEMEGQVRELPLVDRNVFDRFGADFSPKQRAQFLRRCIENAEGAGERMASAGSQLEEVVREAHGLRGTSATLGLTRISQLAGEIEDRAREGDPVERLVAELRTAVSDTEAELRTLGVGGVGALQKP